MSFYSTIGLIQTIRFLAGHPIRVPNANVIKLLQMAEFDPTLPEVQFPVDGTDMPQELVDSGMSPEKFDEGRAHFREGIDSGDSAAWALDARRRALAGETQPVARANLLERLTKPEV